MLIKKSVINGLVAILFLGFTLFLGIQTWNIQNSYNPMVGCPDTKVYPNNKQVPVSKKYCYDKKLKQKSTVWESVKSTLSDWKNVLESKIPNWDFPTLSLPDWKLPKFKLPEFKFPDWKFPDFKSLTLLKGEQ